VAYGAWDEVRVEDGNVLLVRVRVGVRVGVQARARARLRVTVTVRVGYGKAHGGDEVVEGEHVPRLEPLAIGAATQLYVEPMGRPVRHALVDDGDGGLVRLGLGLGLGFGFGFGFGLRSGLGSGLGLGLDDGDGGRVSAVVHHKDLEASSRVAQVAACIDDARHLLRVRVRVRVRVGVGVRVRVRVRVRAGGWG